MQILGSLKLLMALLGPSWPLLGPIWPPNGPQNGPQSNPNMVQKLVQKMTPKKSKIKPILGPKMDPKMGPRAAQNWLPFWTHFWFNFGVAFGGFWVPSGPQDWPGRGLEEPKRAKWSSERPKRQLSKKWFSHRTVCIFSLLRPPKTAPRSPEDCQRTSRGSSEA